MADRPEEPEHAGPEDAGDYELTAWKRAPGLSGVERALSMAETGLNLVGVTVLGLVMLWVVANVVARYVFDYPLYGHLESTEMAMAGIVFLGIAYTHRTNGHVRMELALRRIRGRWFHLAEAASNLLALLVFLVVMYYTWQSALRALEFGDVSGTAYFPLWPPKMVIPIGLLALNLRFTVLIVQHLVQFFAGQPRRELA